MHPKKYSSWIDLNNHYARLRKEVIPKLSYNDMYVKAGDQAHDTYTKLERVSSPYDRYKWSGMVGVKFCSPRGPHVGSLQMDLHNIIHALDTHSPYASWKQNNTVNWISNGSNWSRSNIGDNMPLIDWRMDLDTGLGSVIPVEDMNIMVNKQIISCLMHYNQSSSLIYMRGRDHDHDYKALENIRNVVMTLGEEYSIWFTRANASRNRQYIERMKQSYKAGIKPEPSSERIGYEGLSVLIFADDLDENSISLIKLACDTGDYEFSLIKSESLESDIIRLFGVQNHDS